MSRLVDLVDQWEYQCCGDPLIVGSEVDLTLTPQSDDPLLGPDGRRVEWLVEHHRPDGPLRHVHARVMALWEWRVRLEYREHGDPAAWYPVTGSDEFTPVDRMEVGDEQWHASRTGAQPAGWAVELLTPPEPASPAAPTADRP